MDSTVVCPDCGGVIGGNGQDGRKPCICDDAQPGPRPGMPDPVAKPKVCCKCGKDLSGKKRFKDSLGYWCEACHFDEKQAKVGEHVPCDSCGRYVAPDKLADYENIRICSRCLKERKRMHRKARRPVVFGNEHREQEKKNLLTLAIIAGILLVIIIFASMGLLKNPL